MPVREGSLFPSEARAYPVLNRFRLRGVSLFPGFGEPFAEFIFPGVIEPWVVLESNWFGRFEKAEQAHFVNFPGVNERWLPFMTSTGGMRTVAGAAPCLR
jgi:hypothetical protein